MDLRRGGGLALVAVASLIAGYAVLWAIQRTLALVWGGDGVWGGAGPPSALVVALPAIAGVGVAALRRVGADGHAPLDGLQMGPVVPRDYTFLLGAVLVSLIGGVALGPEVALLLTGGCVATVLARPLHVDQDRAVLVGSMGAILALAVGPIRSGTLDVSAGYVFSPVDPVVGAVGAVAVAASLAVVRWLAFRLQSGVGIAPVWWRLAIAGAFIGGIAVAYRAMSGQSVDLVMTSGEAMIHPLLGLESAGLIVLTVAAKAVAYALSLGSGFRGGAYFPAMFIGAGLAGAGADLAATSVQAASAAGIVAAVTYIARAKWLVTIVIGVAVGVIVGGVALLPVTVIGALCGRALPGVSATTRGAAGAQE